MRITGDMVISALAMMGHNVLVQGRRHDPSQQTRAVAVRYQRHDDDHYHEAVVTVSDEAVARGGDAVLTEVIQRAMMAVVPREVLDDAGRVLGKLDRGPLPCELIGGPRDGEVVTGLQLDHDGWPIERFYVPLAAPLLPSWREGEGRSVYPSAVTRVATYEREWVNPSTLHWRYLALKDA